MIRSEQREVATGGSVAIVTIDRTERRNALDTDTCRQLHSALTGAVEAGARVIVLNGAGGHFCAGADLKTVRDDAFRSALRSVLDALFELPVACIAAVEGFALGAGVQLAVACDLRVAAESARFGVPAARLGLMVDHWTVQRVATVVGHSMARSMLLAAEQVDAPTALRLGLAHRSGGLEDALAWAAEIASLAPLSIAGHKLALNRLEAPPSDPDVVAAYRRAWESADLAEGQRAFAEKRPPRFSGR